jgi:hypothetical protein
VNYGRRNNLGDLGRRGSLGPKRNLG